ncbi:MAG TPA: biopolymer transporter ExbD [Pirellulaceae bacterium]|nr:biopolymer transporter ExbD [Pirellulaceae bacterium]
MIDCVFLLMVYFIWTSSFGIVENVLPSRLSAIAGTGAANPSQPPPPEADFDNVVVRILFTGAAPSWSVNDAPVATLSDLKAQLAAVASVKNDAPVILHPDPEVDLGHVIEAYDLARTVGFERVQFAASQQVK